MPEAQRQLIEIGAQRVIANGEVQTLSGIEATLVTLNYLKNEEGSIDR